MKLEHTPVDKRTVCDGCVLKPCPFCGEEVRFDVSFEQSRLFTGECTGCGMKFEYKEIVTRRDWMIGVPYAREDGETLFENHNTPFVEVWNKRAQEQHTGG